MSRIYSWSKFLTRTAGAAFELPIRPQKLVFVVTKRCHSRCVYCDIWKAKDAPGGLDGELTLHEVDALAAANPFLQWIDFTGGEPTDRPDFVEVVEAFDRHCRDLLLVHFPTNGIATKRITSIVEKLQSTIRARIVVTVSIDGPPEINDRLRGIRNDFAHAIDSFIEIRRLLGDNNAFVGMTLHGYSNSCGQTTTELMKSTFSAINSALTARESSEIDWGSFHLNIPHLSQHYYGNTQSRPDDGFGSKAHRIEIDEALRYASAQKKGGSIGMRYVEKVFRSEAASYLANGTTSISCSALLQTAYLSEKGQVFPCTIWNKPLGNVRESNFKLMPLIEAARTSGLRRRIRDGQCPRCWTPCEAYPAILAAPRQAILSLARA